MKVEVTRHTLPKSEHTIDTNEDAAGLRSDLGLFIVCDGVGTRSFSREWAQILVQHALKVPLVGIDPFEVEWWLRIAQKTYEQSTPNPATLNGHHQMKALEGAQSTFLLFRVAFSQNKSAEAQLVAFGDSCAILRRHGDQHLQWFPLSECAQFDRNPVCLPARTAKFDRDFHKGSITNWTVGENDRLVLATDAVARWIADDPKGMANPGRFDEVTGIAPADWEEFVLDRRRKGEMVDDDSTATILRFVEEGAAETLGTTAELPTDVSRQREQELRQAQESGRSDLIARAWGDGHWFKGDASALERQAANAKRISQAFKIVVEALQIAVREEGGPGSVRQKVQPVWDAHSSLLISEPCAVDLRNTLSNNFQLELFRTDPELSAEKADLLRDLIRPQGRDSKEPESR